MMKVPQSQSVCMQYRSVPVFPIEILIPSVTRMELLGVKATRESLLIYLFIYLF